MEEQVGIGGREVRKREGTQVIRTLYMKFKELKKQYKWKPNKNT